MLLTGPYHLLPLALARRKPISTLTASRGGLMGTTDKADTIDHPVFHDRWLWGRDRH